MAINCSCSDSTGYRTLAQLRTALFNRLGFIDPMANTATRTLALLRADIARRLGYAAQVASGSYPPGESDLIDGFINEAQQTLFRRVELDKGSSSLPARMSADSDATTIDYVPVFNLALAFAKSHRGDADAKVYFEVVERYLKDVANRRPPNATALCTEFLVDAQLQIVRRYPAVRMDRWFTWNLTQGERFYDFGDNAEQDDDPPCTKLIDTLAIKWVGASRDTAWYALRNGIPPELLGSTQTGFPTHYEIKQCLEVWPTPAATEGTIQIRAGFMATAFASDGDQPSIDDELVLLMALANAKAHWKHPDAGLILQEFETHLMGVVGGSHGATRYVPATSRGDSVYVEPRPTVPFA